MYTLNSLFFLLMLLFMYFFIFLNILQNLRSFIYILNLRSLRRRRRNNFHRLSFLAWFLLKLFIKLSNHLLSLWYKYFLFNTFLAKTFLSSFYRLNNRLRCAFIILYNIKHITIMHNFRIYFWLKPHWFHYIWLYYWHNCIT